MKFMSGMILGGMLAAGATWMYTNNSNSKRMMRKGKQIVKKMGLM